MTFYSLATEAIRSALLDRHPLNDKESLSVHIRAAGCQVVITRARTDRPEIVSERVCGMDESI